MHHAVLFYVANLLFAILSGMDYLSKIPAELSVQRGLSVSAGRCSQLFRAGDGVEDGAVLVKHVEAEGVLAGGEERPA